MSEFKSYPITKTAFKWLEMILANRFGHTWTITQIGENLGLELNGYDGKIIFDSSQICLTEAHSNQPICWWNAEGEGWESILGGRIPAPGIQAYQLH